MNVVYERSAESGVERRILLSNPSEVRVGDHFQRNSDPIETISIVDGSYLFATRNDSIVLPLDEPIYVWRDLIN